MQKLKKEVFLTILIILTISLIITISIFFFRNYNQEKNKIFNALNTSETVLNIDINNHKGKLEIYNKPTYIDSVIYVVILDNNNNILDVINHSQNNLTNEDITLIANKILKNGYEGINVNLFLRNYSYSYVYGNSLTILDNTDITTRLYVNLTICVIIFILFETIFIYITHILTNKITKPVEETFLKQKTFIADASHELKTPLSVIIASIDALEENPDEKKWLKNIKSESERMNNLIVRLLDLAESERNIEQEKSLENLSKVIELSLLTFEGKAFEKNIKIDYKIQDNIEYKIDVNSIKQLIEILLDNAIKHSNKNSKIFVNLNMINNDIIFTVKNKGKDIPKGEEEKIFERFYRTDKSRTRKENRYGLGLAIAKNIVQNHNGSISASSLDGYTTFKIIFKKGKRGKNEKNI